MGLKVAVVGGGSTYTPELVEGFARRAAVLPIDELVLLDPDPERLEIVGGLAGRILRRAGLARAADADRRPVGRPRRRRRSRSSSCGSAARRRGSVDETLPLKFGLHRPGDDRARRVREGAAHGAAGPRDRRGGPRGAARPASWILDFTNPVGIVTQALLDAGHRAIGLCNVAIGFQRGLARHFDVDAGAGRARPRRPQPPVVDPGGPGRRRRPAAGAARGRRRGGDPRRRLPARGRPGAGRDPVLLPALLLRDRRRAARAARRARAGRPTSSASSASSSTCTATRRWTTSPSCSSGAAARTTARPRRRSSSRSTPATARSTSSTCATRGAIPNLPDDAVVEVPARIDRSGATPLPTAPLAPEMLGLVQHVKAYEALAIEAALSGEDADRAPGAGRQPARQGRRPGAPRRDHRGQPALPPPLRPDPRSDGPRPSAAARCVSRSAPRSRRRGSGPCGGTPRRAP